MPLRIDTDPGDAPLFEGMTPAEFARAFRLPPDGAVRYMQGRDRVKLTYDWRELWQEEHARQFTVSRLGRVDLLDAVRRKIEASVNGDLTRRDWMRDAKKLLAEAGWWGEKWVTGPDGELKRTVFNPARLKLIYDVNTRMAYAAGRWERIQAAKASHPYLRYVTRADERVRASHALWHNVTLPVDDPWWQTHYPPNGWRCRCRAVPMRATEYERRDDLRKAAPAEPAKAWTDTRTGEVRRIPAHIDPGFDYNVGDAAMRHGGLDATLASKLADWPPALAAAARASGLTVAGPEKVRDWTARALRERDFNGDALALTPVPVAALARIAAAAGVAARGRVFVLRSSETRHIGDRHGPGATQPAGQLPVDTEDYVRLARLISVGALENARPGEPAQTPGGGRLVELTLADELYRYTLVVEVGRHTLWPYTLWKVAR